MRVLHALSALSLIGSAGCELSPHGRCRLAPAQRVALAHGSEFDATALVVSARGALAFFSDRAGLWAQPLSDAGAARGAATRLGERCEGGIAAARVDDAVALACTRHDGAEGQVLAMRVVLGDHGIEHDQEIALARVGAASRGLSLSLTPKHVAIAFHDGGPDAHRVWVVRLPHAMRGAISAPEALSKSGTLASSPSLVTRDGRLYAAFVTWQLRVQSAHAELWVRDLDGNAQSRTPLHHFDAAPKLGADDAGLVLTYRDRPTTNARVEQFVGRLGSTLAFVGPPVRIGRASGVWGPTLEHCGSHGFSAAPIEHGSELYVIFHALDAAFHPLEPNHQCYATDRDLVGAQTACSHGDILALVMEQTDPSGEPAELFGMRFGCAR